MKTNRMILLGILATLFVGSATAESSIVNKTTESLDTAGKKIDQTADVVGSKVSAAADVVGTKVNSASETVGNYVDDSTVTARVKKALFDAKDITSLDISVSTLKGVVTLSGFVATPEELVKAITTATAVNGVVSVSDKLHVKGEHEETVKGYAIDALITSEVKAKLLAEKAMPSLSINVETVDGIVQLVGSVKNSEQIAMAEHLAKEVKGVKSVKNDLKLQP